MDGPAGSDKQEPVAFSSRELVTPWSPLSLPPPDHASTKEETTHHRIMTWTSFFVYCILQYDIHSTVSLILTELTQHWCFFLLKKTDRLIVATLVAVIRSCKTASRSEISHRKPR